MGSLASCIRSKNKQLGSTYASGQNISQRLISKTQNSSESISIEEEYKRLQSKKKKIEKHKEVSSLE